MLASAEAVARVSQVPVMVGLIGFRTRRAPFNDSLVNSLYKTDGTHGSSTGIRLHCKATRVRPPIVRQVWMDLPNVQTYST